jgi:hypothetical protein
MERIIYKFEGFKLPFPITPRQFVFFVYGELLVFILLKIPGINMIRDIPFAGHPLMTFIIYPYFIMKYLSNKKLDGKAPHKYAWDMIMFLIFTPKKWEHYKPVKKPFKEKIYLRIPYRLEKIKSSIELNFKNQEKKKSNIDNKKMDKSSISKLTKKNKKEDRLIYHPNY